MKADLHCVLKYVCEWRKKMIGKKRVTQTGKAESIEGNSKWQVETENRMLKKLVEERTVEE